MMRLSRLPVTAATFPLALLVNAVTGSAASAHVKWFCAYDVAGQPEGLENVMCPDFEFLIGLSVLALMSGALLEGSAVGVAMQRSLDRATRFVRDNIETIFRAACAFFFISVWAVGGILLTPELKISSTLVGAIQLGIAAGMVSRRSLPLSALGIAVLYAIAIWNYGLFHLADYPVLLGVAVYLALTGLQRDLFGLRPLDVLRITASITLMWASIEKWAYPEWTYPLMIQHPGMTLGFAPDFFMRAAGAIEFALAFALIWTPLVRRAAAVMLTAMFVSAVFPFGKIDLIGHTLIVTALLAIAADDQTRTMRSRDSWLLPPVYAGTLAAFLAVYYLGHAAIYGTSVL
jgi:hypothetical protein